MERFKKNTKMKKKLLVLESVTLYTVMVLIYWIIKRFTPRVIVRCLNEPEFDIAHSQ